MSLVLSTPSLALDPGPQARKAYSLTHMGNESKGPPLSLALGFCLSVLQTTVSMERSH